MTRLRVLSTLGLAGVLQELAPSLPPIDLQLAPTQTLVERIAAGERGDVAILTDVAIDELIGAGILDRASRTDLARSHVGVAVRQGASRPNIATPEAFVAALLGARSVALSRAGASGLYMAGLLERLGIAEAVYRKATVIPSGFTGELVARGEAELAIQQLSELMAVPGLDILGRLPQGIEGVSVFTATLFIGASDAAEQVLQALRTSAVLMQEKGLEPMLDGQRE
jgi:molybdate transport system substrate-binding protein